MTTRRKSRWKTILPTVTLTAIPFTVYLPTANAFFPPISPPPPIVGVVPPVVPPPIIVPPVVPPPFVPPVVPPVIVVPPVSPPPVIVDPGCHCPPSPNCVPEPTTILSAFFGLAAIAGYNVRRRKEVEPGEQQTGE